MTALRIAAGLAGATAITAITVHVLAADQARGLLGFDFEGLPRQLGESADIFANNTRVLGAVMVACAIVQIGHRAEAGWERALCGGLARTCDAALIGACLLHVLVIGSAFGAYGRRTLETALAHGPFELAAFSLALGAYVAGRGGPLPAWRLPVAGLAAVAALAVGSLLEVFA